MSETGYAPLAVGDAVVVFDVNGRRRGQPPGGWPGLVTKVGRTLVTIRYGHGRGQEEQFRIDTRRVNDSYGHRSFTTPEEAERTERRRVAEAALRDRGVLLDHRCGLNLDEIEGLVAVVSQRQDGGVPADGR